jgi:hypothetical protein
MGSLALAGSYDRLLREEVSICGDMSFHSLSRTDFHRALEISALPEVYESRRRRLISLSHEVVGRCPVGRALQAIVPSIVAMNGGSLKEKKVEGRGLMDAIAIKPLPTYTCF